MATYYAVFVYMRLLAFRKKTPSRRR